MKRFLKVLTVIVFVCALAVSASAKTKIKIKTDGSGDRGFGVGVILGQPSGLSLKLWNGPETALDAAVAWHFAGYLAMHADYLIHNFDIIEIDGGRLPLYFGLGVAASAWNGGFGMGVRVPLGMAYIFDNAPIDVFLEVVPGIAVVPGFGFGVDGGLGVRYWFK